MIPSLALGGLGRAGAVATPSGDPYFASVVSLLHFEDSDASTIFTDQTGKTWTARSSAQIDTAQFKYGASALLLDGTGDCIDTPDSADWYMPGDFCFEMWLRPASMGVLPMYVQGQGAASFGVQNYVIYVDSGSKVHTYCYDGASAVCEMTGVTNLTVGVWHHVAWTRSGNVHRLFADGLQEATVTDSYTMPDIAAKFGIGRVGESTWTAGGDQNFFNGWIDEFRATNGVPRYTSNFTPAPAPDS